MRNPFAIFYKLIKKVIALLMLTVLTIFSCIYHIAFFCYRLVAIVFSSIGIVMVAADSVKYGFTAERGLMFLFFLFIVALRFLLPLLIPVLQDWADGLKYYVYKPLIIRSPVRYTI